jgi:hypothetical protein
MKDDYDFSRGVRGKYAKQFVDGTNVVVLDPEVAKQFPTSEAVNKALRKLIKDQKKDFRSLWHLVECRIGSYRPLGRAPTKLLGHSSIVQWHTLPLCIRFPDS